MQLRFHKSCFVLIVCLLITIPVHLEAFNLKGKVKSTSKSVDLSTYTIVAEGDEENIVSTKLSSNGSFILNGVSSGDRLSLLENNNYYGPIVLAIKSGNKTKSYSTANKKGLCSSGSASAVMALKKKPSGKDGSLIIQLDSENEFGYAKKTLASKFLASDETASVDESTCILSGLADTSDTQSLGAKILDENSTDPDQDGTNNEEDVDDDNDGLSDTFDLDNDGDNILDDADSDNNDQVENRVWNFQQLHLNRENAYNTRVMDVTTEVIDNALTTYGGLAIQVIDGTQVELDCGGDSEEGTGLVYCSSGGPGRAREPYPNGLALPDEMDEDSDGKAEIEAGPTGDFQAAPGATSTEIRPGDTFIEEVSDGDGKVTKYAGMINGVVHDVPGIVSITTSIGTSTFTYPGTSTSIGAATNPISVPSSGDVLVTVTTYVPHYEIGEATRVVPAKVKMTSTIPNGPCTYDSTSNTCSGSGSGPGLLPGSLYSNPSTGWEVVSDGIQNTSEENIPEGEDSTVTYTVNLAGTGGVTGWDSGEQVMVPIQSLDNNGTTAAHNVWFKRQ